MPRYIDADALKDRMLNYYGCVNADTSKSNYRGETLMNYEVADMIDDCIDNAPTIDVAEFEALRAQCKELKFALDRSIDEKSKIAVMHEELLKENAELKSRLEFCSGQIEAYKYCIDNIRR